MSTRINIPVQGNAELYDHYTSTFLGDYDRAFVNRVVEEYGDSSESKHLVDIGTGTARILLQIAEIPRLEALQMVGTEFFDDMVVKARDVVRDAAQEARITIDYADVHDMPYPDNHFDYLISRSTLHHWAKPIRALQEIYRVLKPGGVGIIHDLRRDPDPDALKIFNSIRAQAGLGPTRIEEKYTPAETEAMLKEAGFWHDCSINAPTKGKGAVGYELTIRKTSSA